jgi:hypothetical protein
VEAAGLWGKTAGVGGGVTIGWGSQFSGSSTKNLVGDMGNGASINRGEGDGVLFAESALTISGTRQSNLDRWVAGPSGTSLSLASTKIVKPRLPLRFFCVTLSLGANGVEGNGVEGSGVEGNGVEGNDIEAMTGESV